jgi:hypothetical protein
MTRPADAPAETTEAAEAGEPLRYVFVAISRCPVCGSAELKTLRSENQEDGSILRRTKCRTCQHPFFVVLE